MRYIKYIGPAHMRQITADEWKRVGIQADTVIWGNFNGWSVGADLLTDEQIRRAIDPDSNFVIVGSENMPKPVMNDRATPTAVAAGDFDLADQEDLNKAFDTTTNDGQLEDPTPSSTAGGAPSEKANR